MRIAYRKTEGKVELVRFWGPSEIVKVPEEIDGCPVVSVAPYAFSNHKGTEDSDVLYYEDAEEFTWEGESLRCGGNLTEIHLPETVQIIGNYAFYGCINMKLFHVTDQVVRMGSGVFTGCRLSRVQIDFYEGEKSCLKEILTEIRYEIMVTFRYYKEIQGKAEENAGYISKIVFPEYYADAVENTPARIVETHYYGSGGDYRECFYRRELDFLKYDSMFALSAARDHEEVTACVALARLMYPVRLAVKAKGRYEEYVREHMTDITMYCLEHLKENEKFSIADPMEVVNFCCREQYFSEEALEAGIAKASEYGQTEVLCVLMDERHKRFPKKKKSFAL